MQNLLIGADLDSAFFSLNAHLRESTVEFARQKFGFVTGYNPWLCYTPAVAEIPPALIEYSTAKRGELVTASDKLAVMADFMGGAGHAPLDDLPGEKGAWLPSADNISDVYGDAIAALTKAPILDRLFREIVDNVVPLGGGKNRGYSTHFARGAIFRSLPAGDNAYDVAFDIAHEVGHQVLMVWQSVDPILVSDLEAPVYSQIRKRDRPAIQSFHATVALAFMRYLELSQPDDHELQAAAKRRGASYGHSLSHSLELAIASIRQHCEVSELGERMLDEMEALV